MSRKNKEKSKPEPESLEKKDETEEQVSESPETGENQEETGSGPTASPKSGNTHLRRLMDTNFIEYASYVIKDRAIPDVDDGLKPVQRRILWSLRRMDDGKFHKVANVIGHTMQYHPHGDASIGDALVVLANKEYFIERQGNFGNIFTGDMASAARYIECRLSPLAREVLFNNDITEFVDSYDGRNREPLALPCKIPSLLMLGSDGIAVGMSTKILSHNFKELLEAQIAILNGEKFTIYPDFIQGGMMDVSDYNDGNGRITLRAKIEKSGRKLIVREIPAVTTTEKLIASIENAVRRNKIKISSINDYTTDKIEIEITPARGYDTDKALNALYAYTDCAISITTNMIVIADNKPVKMAVSEVLKRNTGKLVESLKRELEIELGKLHESFHEKTLVQIFIENKIYKRIEKAETYDKVQKEVKTGLAPFRHMLKRDVSDADIEKLLAIPIRRISLFDINKNKKDIDDIVLQVEEVQKNLKRIKAFTIKYLKHLIDKYAGDFPRKTEIETFDKINVHEVALNNIKVGWDKKNCFVGTAVKSEDTATCNEYDRLLCIERSCKYKVIAIPEKIFIGRLFYFCKYDKSLIFNVVYRDRESGFCFAKRTKIPKFITDKEYNIAPPGSKLEIINTRPNYVYECVFEPKARQKQNSVILDFSKIPMRGPQSRGFKIAGKKVIDFKFLGVMENGNIIAPGQETQQAPAPAEAADTPQQLETTQPASQQQPESHEPDEKLKVKPEKKPKKKSPERETDSKKIAKAVKGAEKKKESVKEEKSREKTNVPEKKKTSGNKKKSDDLHPQLIEMENKEEKEKTKTGKQDKIIKKPDSGKKGTTVKKSVKTDNVKKTGTAKSAKTGKKGGGRGSDGSNEWGISQPEFGF